MAENPSTVAGSRRRARLRVLATMVLFLLGTLSHASAQAAGAPAADGPKRVGFGVVPASATHIDQRSLFSYGLGPGATAYDHVAVLNYSSAPLSLGVAPLDALNSTEGGFALQPSAQAPADLGAWVKIRKAPGLVKVPGRDAKGAPGKVILPVEIAVPLDASPGDHAAGIVAVLTTVGKNPAGQNVNLEQRVAARVYVKVSGPIKPALTIAALDADYHPGRWPWQAGSVKVTFEVVNSGNVRMGYDPALRVAGFAGLGGRTVGLDPVAELLPHNSQTMTTTVDGVWPLVWMSARLTASPTPAVAALPPELGQVSRSVGTWALSWWVVGLVLLVLGFTLHAVLRRRRRVGGPRPDRRGWGRPSAGRRGLGRREAAPHASDTREGRRVGAGV